MAFSISKVDAHHSGSKLEPELLAWAETRLDALRQEPGGGFYTLVHEQDATRIALLERHGYTRGDPWLYMRRSLAEPLPEAQLPPGFSVRSVTDESEAEARAAVLAAPFEAPPRPERYRRFMQSPGYNPDLDLVAVAPDGRFGAFALCWLDRINAVGQFEPVGTHPDFQRMGLARAVLLEGLWRMRLQGARSAIVIVGQAEQAARALYASVGLKPCWKLYLYGKER